MLYLVTQATKGKSRNKLDTQGSFRNSKPGTRSVFAAATMAILVALTALDPAGVITIGDARAEGLNSERGLAPGALAPAEPPRPRDTEAFEFAIELRMRGSHVVVTEFSVAGLEASYSTITQSAARSFALKPSLSEPAGTIKTAYIHYIYIGIVCIISTHPRSPRAWCALRTRSCSGAGPCPSSGSEPDRQRRDDYYIS